MSIRQKLLLLFSVQIIIPMLFMGTMLYKNAETIIKNKSVSYSADLLKMIELRLNDFSNSMVAVSDDLLYDSNIYDMLDEQKDASLTVKENERSYTYNTLRRICLSHKEIQSIALVSNNNTKYSYDLNAGRVSLEDSMPNSELHITARTAAGKAAWFFEKDEQDNIKNVYLTRVIYNQDDLNERGLIIVQINRDNLKQIYSDLSTEFMQRINILNSENKWIIGTNENWNVDEHKALLEQGKTWTYQIDKKNKTLLTYRSLKGINWKIVAEASMDKMLNEEIHHFRFVFVTITICTVLILSIFSILMAMDIITPINRLVYSIKKMDEENIHQEVVVDREDEIGYLSKCFNKMSGQIDILVNRVYKEQLTRKEAELKALQAQINPHFLFNTLESINWMAQLNNVPEIRDMVTSLGALMEASIGKGNAMVPLSKELKYVDSYILIMKNRYGERLVYESNIDHSLLRSEVPKLLLQPLIENAIYHGIDRMRQKGIIKLTIQRTDDNKIYIEIMDNGKGMTKEQVDALNEKFEVGNDDYLLEGQHKGIGLENVNRRVKLFFGNEYGLTIESEYEVYTKMKLIIPVNR